MSAMNALDLVFLYADPLVSQHEQSGQEFEYIVPLDLEAEYTQMVKALSQTRRRFSICREPMNVN
jgi:hypothetical protein